MYTLLGIIVIFGVPIYMFTLIVAHLRNNHRKPYGIGIIVAYIFLIIGILISLADNNTKTDEAAKSTEEYEIEFTNNMADDLK